MVTVSRNSTDRLTAWRIRDILAEHPLLGGATAQISVIANHESIVLEGWTVDEDVRSLAIRLAGRSAGRRTVKQRLEDPDVFVPHVSARRANTIIT